MRGRTQEVLGYIAVNVRTQRLARRITQEQLAEATRYDVRLVQYVESGARNLTIDSLVAFADALEVPVHQLLEPASAAGPARRVRRKK